MRNEERVEGRDMDQRREASTTCIHESRQRADLDE